MTGNHRFAIQHFSGTLMQPNNARYDDAQRV